MPRPKRRQLKFDEESANKLLQEIYDESHNIKGKITTLLNKWETKVKELGEVAAVGDQVVKLIAALGKNQDQKITLLKVLKEIVYEKNKASGVESTGDGKEVTSDDRNDLINMVNDELEKRK